MWKIQYGVRISIVRHKLLYMCACIRKFPFFPPFFWQLFMALNRRTTSCFNFLVFFVFFGGLFLQVLCCVMCLSPRDYLMAKLPVGAVEPAGATWLLWKHGRLVALGGALGRAGTGPENRRIGVEGAHQVWHILHQYVSVYPAILRLIITFPLDPQLCLSLVRACVGDTLDLIARSTILCDQRRGWQVRTT